MMWWLTIGRREYTNVSPSPEQSILAFTFAPSNFVRTAKIPLVLDFILSTRPDVVSEYSTNDIGGYKRALEWFLRYGIAEYEIADVIPPAFVEWLDAEAVDLEGRRIEITNRNRLYNQSNNYKEYIISDVNESSQDISSHYSSLLRVVMDACEREKAVEPTDQNAYQDTADISLVGYAYGELGVGEDVRSMAHSLKAVNERFNIIDFPENLRARQMDVSAERTYSKPL